VIDEGAGAGAGAGADAGAVTGGRAGAGAGVTTTLLDGVVPTLMKPGLVLVLGLTMLGLLTSRLAVGSLPPPPPPQAASVASNMTPGTCLSEPLRFSLKVVLVFMSTYFSVCRSAGCCLCRLGKGTWATSTGSGFTRDFFHATCCTYLDDNGVDFRGAVRELRHQPDGTPIENDVWKLTLIDGAFTQTNGQPLPWGYRHATWRSRLPATRGECLSRKGRKGPAAACCWARLRLSRRCDCAENLKPIRQAL